MGTRPFLAYHSQIVVRANHTQIPHATNTSCTKALCGAILFPDVPLTAYCVVSCNTHTSNQKVKLYTVKKKKSTPSRATKPTQQFGTVSGAGRSSSVSLEDAYTR